MYNRTQHSQMFFGLLWIFIFIALFLPFYAHLHGFNAGVKLAVIMGLAALVAAIKGAILPKQILLTSIIVALLSFFVKLTVEQLVLVYVIGWFVLKEVNITPLWYL